MCCLITTMLFAGPRVAIILWWLVSMERWEAAFDSFIVPFLGFIFLPWTTIMYVAVAPTGSVSGIDWLWLAIAFIADLASYSGGAYGNKDRYTRSGYGPTPAYFDEQNSEVSHFELVSTASIIRIGDRSVC